MEKNNRQDLTVQRAHPKRTERLSSERHHVSFTAIECLMAAGPWRGVVVVTTQWEGNQFIPKPWLRWPSPYKDTMDC